jgi:hypothetical protein
LFLNVGIAPSHIEHLAELKSDQFTNTQNQMGGLIRHHLMKHLIATASVKIPLVQDPRHFLDIELWLHWCENIAKNIHFWFDYVCLPQHPQNDSEDKYFHEALDFLELIQKQMNTLVVDLGDNYYGWAWCVSEWLLQNTYSTPLGFDGKDDLWSNMLPLGMHHGKLASDAFQCLLIMNILRLKM